MFMARDGGNTGSDIIASEVVAEAPAYEHFIKIT